MKKTMIPVLSATVAVMAAFPAMAHTGAGTTASFAAGLTHPLFGIDHLLAMVGVGLWAGLAGGRALWLIPAAFISAMALGGAAGMEGVALPAVELGIAGSVVALGLLLVFNPSLPTAVAMLLAAAFAVFHGHAHGTEMPATASGLAYGAGFILATAALHGAGLAAVTALRRRITPTRLAGAALGASGLALLAAG